MSDKYVIYNSLFTEETTEQLCHSNRSVSTKALSSLSVSSTPHNHLCLILAAGINLTWVQDVLICRFAIQTSFTANLRPDIRHDRCWRSSFLHHNSASNLAFFQTKLRYKLSQFAFKPTCFIPKDKRLTNLELRANQLTKSLCQMSRTKIIVQSSDQ